MQTNAQRTHEYALDMSVYLIASHASFSNDAKEENLWKLIVFKSISVVCSRHFLPRDYSSWTPVRKRLQKGAVPTVFEDIVSLGLEVKSAHDNLESQNITTNSSVDKLTHQREVKYFQNYKLIAENDMCHTFETSHPVLSKRDDNESTGSLRNKKKKHTSVSNEDTSMFYLHRKIESRILKRKRLETHVSNIWSKKKSCC
ncbi:hypothetical protein DPMN_086776 [Dreissena polymorpha]|uniref:THAP-type domain-containing protein n=1 Tax=Dreissena polymorpha TaxID=45954 RepID=A0A9D4KRT8_DREPO|nr:hypothetical protein DPMN_086776 [Dreissena polymorpha]